MNPNLSPIWLKRLAHAFSSRDGRAPVLPKSIWLRYTAIIIPLLGECKIHPPGQIMAKKT